jgi:predicted permease
MPDTFFGETLRPDPPDAWVPITFEPLLQGKNSLLASDSQQWLYIMGRLRPTASPGAQSDAATSALQSWLSTNPSVSAEQRPEIPKQHIVVTSARGGVSLLRYNSEQSLRVLAIAALAVLLIACANLANLLLARGLSRGPELALRTALGAPRSRLIREALVDAALLAAVGAGISIALASAGSERLMRLAYPAAARLPVAPATSWSVLLFALVIAAGSAVLFAVIPAVMTSRFQAVDATRGSARVVGDRGHWARRSLVVVQVALSLALATSAGLLVKNVVLLETQALGFQTDGRFLVSLDQTLGGTPPGALPALYQRLEEQLMRVPGARRVSLSLYGPLVGNNWSSGVVVEGREHGDGQTPTASWDRVSAGHFEAMGTPLLRGRSFDERDTPGSERVAVVNETFARQVLKAADPIGRRFGFAAGADHSRDFLVVGLVGDAKYATPRGPAFPTFFLPFFQNVPYTDESASSVQTRSNYASDIEIWAQAAPSIEQDVRAAIATASPSLSVRRFKSMPEQVNTNFTRERLVTSLAGLFAVLALLLACVGLYGVTAYNVSRRVREIGVRMALGADRARVMRGVMAGALVTTGIGLAIGIAAALAAGRLLRDQLFGVSATDATVFLTAGTVLVLATVVASAIPARRAATIDPIVALRAD